MSDHNKEKIPSSERPGVVYYTSKIHDRNIELLRQGAIHSQEVRTIMIRARTAANQLFYEFSQTLISNFPVPIKQTKQ